VQLKATVWAFLQNRGDKPSLNNLQHRFIERVVFLGKDFAT
jgi:hypothetical protein